MRLLFCVVAGAVFFFWSCKEKRTSPDEILLELKLKEGQKYITEMEISQSMEADVNGVFSLIDQSIEFKLSSEVVKDSSELYKISNQYRRLYFSQSQSDDEKEDLMTIDTDGMQSETLETELEKYYYELIQNAFLTYMDKNGLEVSSELDEMNKRIGGDKFTSPFQKMFQYGVFFPDYILERKDVWHKEVSLKNDQIVVTGNTRYQLETWDKELVYIQMRSQLKGRHIGFDVNGQIDVEKSGIIILYRATGWIKEATIDQSIKWLDINTNENRLLGQIKIKSYPEK